jgi:hypothetical protein
VQIGGIGSRCGVRCRSRNSHGGADCTAIIH